MRVERSDVGVTIQNAAMEKTILETTLPHRKRQLAVRHQY